MKGYLTTNQIDFVMFHLDMVLDITEDIRERILFHKDGSTGNIKGKIVFQLSAEPYSQEEVVMEDEIPILFPVRKGSGIYQLQNNSLIFQYDLLKSAFYLLSGYQELNPEHLDSMDRYPYELSVQSSLKVAGKPLVNYYFKMIVDGIREFCKGPDLKFAERSIFGSGAVFMSHDVDIVDTYALPEVIYRFKQVLGIARSPDSWWRSFHLALHYLYNYVILFSKNNPHWDFPFLIKVESDHGIRSAFFFLPKDQKHADAYYSFSEPRMKRLFNDLDRENFEIGLHGTVRSSTSLSAMKEIVALLQKDSPQKVLGIRQHRLKYDIKSTPFIQHEAGIQYDTTLGFAEHEGFRNSYCLPFRLYDHGSDQMLNHWEIPLAVMDVTLFHYREYSTDEAMDAIEKLFKETMKFNGVISLLWHNGINNELLRPGMKEFYINLIKYIASTNLESLLGNEIVSRIKHIDK